MHSHDLTEAGRFRTSSFSGGGNCVEVFSAPDGTFVVRDSKDPRREVCLVFTRPEWAAFVLGIKNGEFEP